MGLIDKNNTLVWVIRTLDKIPTGAQIEIKSYKRNRIIKILKEKEHFHILEDGFWKEKFIIEKDKIKTILKKLIRREFPRSHKLWVYKIDTK